MLTTFRLAALAVAAGALLATPAIAAPGTIIIGLDNGCEPITGGCTVIEGDWGLKIVRGDRYCPTPEGYGTGTYIGHGGDWDWMSCSG